MQTHDTGDKIQYRLFDKDGKEHWFPGVIHGVRRYEDPKTNAITKVTYLVDTGRDYHVEERQIEVRGEEIARRLEAALADGEDQEKAIKRIAKADDLPDSAIKTVKVRQPEQLELEVKHIRVKGA